MNFEEWWLDILKANKTLPSHISGLRNIAFMSWQAAQPQWQPIETAPLDTYVIFATSKGVFIGLANLSKGSQSEGEIYYSLVTAASGLTTNVSHKPTHWQPLPEPPKGD